MKSLTTWITVSETGVLPEKRKDASASQTSVRIPASPDLAASVAVIATSESESFAMPPALAPALPDTHASRQRWLRLRWPLSLRVLGNSCRHPLQRWGSILEGLCWGAQQRPAQTVGRRRGLMFARLSPVVRHLAARARKVRSALLPPWKYQAGS